ncbi:hypothetical protein GCM10010909_33350 [Acidocella aquatica]|uniref:Uncharacterized protein n=1 Tax=Acidocella aquatica TaxID=1922313 RepID=A0ABQ6ABH3_9PROT|nr:hypothetical protein [Acidocella aquatica]GLR68653.1 hypothetical protein GCM10010909_33350 [Acidocella aquatica]
MFRAYASFLLHLTPEAQRRLPRLDFQATQAVFRAAVTHAAGGVTPVTALIKGEHVTITSREREDGVVIFVLDHNPAVPTSMPRPNRSCL